MTLSSSLRTLATFTKTFALLSIAVASARSQPALTGVPPDNVGVAEIAVADFNAVFDPGLSDIAAIYNDTAAGGQIRLDVYYNNNVPLAFVPQSILMPLVGTVQTLDAGDIDADGDIDLVFYALLPNGTYTAVIHYNQGNGFVANGWNTPNMVATTGVVRDAALADMNGDGLLDIVVAAHAAASDTVEIHLNTAAPQGPGTTFVPAGPPSAMTVSSIGGPDPVRISLGDVDGDGTIDVTVRTGNAPSIMEMHTNPLGLGLLLGVFVFTPPAFPVGTISDVLIADFDGINSSDLAISDTFPGFNVFALGAPILGLTGAPTQTAAANAAFLVPAARTTDMAAADIDGDLDLDVFSCDSLGFVCAFINNGAGVFNPALPPTPLCVNVGFALNSVGIGNFDGAGFLDAAVGGLGGNLSVVLN